MGFHYFRGFTLAKHLRDDDIDAIVNLIRGWGDGKLTWDRVCDNAMAVVGLRPSRQTLNAHAPIVNAYRAKKAGASLQSNRAPLPSSLAVAAQRIAHQQAVINELRQTNSALLTQFVHWQYNAYKYDLDIHKLNEPLPRIDRERTET